MNHHDPKMEPYLQASATINFDDKSVDEFARSNSDEATGSKKKAISLYYAVRDGIRYDPYAIEMTVEGLRASSTLERGRGWCVSKAILLAACCRAIGIPARLGFADLRNHLNSAVLRDYMKTDVFYWHGYTSIHLAGSWIKATPAFNIELCERFQQKPVEFDGKNDSLCHPFDLLGNRHIDYLKYRGEFAEVPIAKILETFHQEYVIGKSKKGSASG